MDMMGMIGKIVPRIIYLVRATASTLCIDMTTDRLEGDLTNKLW